MSRVRAAVPLSELWIHILGGLRLVLDGMMSTILNLGVTAEATDGLAAAAGDPRLRGDGVGVRRHPGRTGSAWRTPPTRRRDAGSEAQVRRRGSNGRPVYLALMRLRTAVAARRPVWAAPFMKPYQSSLVCSPANTNPSNTTSCVGLPPPVSSQK